MWRKRRGRKGMGRGKAGEKETVTEERQKKRSSLTNNDDLMTSLARRC